MSGQWLTRVASISFEFQLSAFRSRSDKIKSKQMKKHVFHLSAALCAIGSLIPSIASGFMSGNLGFKIPDIEGRSLLRSSQVGAGASAKFSKVYAYIHPGNGGEISMYELNSDFSSKLLWKPSFNDVSSRCWYTISWIEGENVCGIVERTTTAGIEMYAYEERALTDGSLKSSRNIALSNSTPQVYYMSGAYVPSEGRIYGYTPGVVEQFSFCCAPVSDIESSSVIKDSPVKEYALGMCYNASDDELYGVNASREFVRIGRDGTQTVLITNLDLNGVNMSVNGAMIYSPKDGKYLFEGYGYDYSAMFYWIDPESKTCHQAASLPKPAFFSCLMPADGVYDADVPDYGRFANPVFPNNYKNSGKVDYIIPENTIGGMSLPEKVQYKIWLDETEVASGEGAPGSTVSVEIQAKAKGYYRIKGVAYAASKPGAIASIRAFIGTDRPRDPENVSLDVSTGELRWTAPVQYVHGAGIQEDITYAVYLNDRMVNPFVRTTSYKFSDSGDVGINPEGRIKTYWTTIQASVLGEKSNMVSSDTVCAGKYLEMPFSLKPERWESVLFTKKNYGLDTWEWRNRSIDFRSHFCSMTDNDGLILPVVKIPEASAGKTYRLTFEAGSEVYDAENVQVFISDDRNLLSNYRPVSALTMVKTIGENRRIEDSHFRTYETFFSVPAGGDYYLSFKHTKMGTSVGRLYLSGFAMEEVDSLDMKVPGYVLVPSAKAVEGPIDKIDVQFIMPAYLLDGTKIASDKVLKAKVCNGHHMVSVEGTPGVMVKTQITGFKGENTITIEIESDGKTGPSTVLSAHAGLDVPTDVTNFSIRYGENPQEVTFYWEKPSNIGFNGRYVDPDDVDYYFAYINSASTWLFEDTDNPIFDQELVRLTPENGLKKDENGRYSWTWRRADGSKLPYRQFLTAIIPANEAGMTLYNRGDAVYDAQGNHPKTQPLSLGEPMQLPFGNPCTNFRYDHGCGFYDMAGVGFYRDKEFAYANYYAEANTFLSGVMGKPALLDDNQKGTLYFYVNTMLNNSVDEGATMDGWAPFSTKGHSEAYINLELYRYLFSPEAEILMECYGMDEPESIATIAKGDRDGEIARMSIRIPDKFMNKAWVRAYLRIKFKDIINNPKQVFMFGSYSFDIKSRVANVVSGQGDIIASDGVITISGYAGTPVSVYTLSGIPVFSSKRADESERIEVSAGVYIVRVGNETVKVMVK